MIELIVGGFLTLDDYDKGHTVKSEFCTFISEPYQLCHESPLWYFRVYQWDMPYIGITETLMHKDYRFRKVRLYSGNWEKLEL